MEIIIKGADFSSLGLGNNRWVENYIINGGITDGAYKTALRNLYNSLHASGVDKKFDVIRLHGSTIANADRLNAINPLQSSASFVGTFYSDAPENHTAQGWNAVEGTYLTSAYNPLIATQNFHIHSLNTTLSSGGIDMKFRNDLPSVRYLNGGILSRQPTFVLAGIRKDGAGNQVNYPNGKTLLSCSNNATTNLQKIYADGNSIGSYTAVSDLEYDSAPSPFLEGRGANGGAAESAKKKILFQGWGSTEWTDTDEAYLYQAINAFAVEIGAI